MMGVAGWSLVTMMKSKNIHVVRAHSVEASLSSRAKSRVSIDTFIRMFSNRYMREVQ